MMKNFLLLISGCLVFSVATESSVQAHPASMEQTTKQAPTASTNKKKSIKGAHLHLPVAAHHFGDVPRKGGDLVKEFTFVNDGTTPLVVTRVLTSCSCLKATFSRRPVAPGGQGVIRITYEPHKSEPGVFNKVIQIYSNSVDGGRDILSVQGNSIDGAGSPKAVATSVDEKIKE